jgi:hypothetical protein
MVADFCAVFITVIVSSFAPTHHPVLSAKTRISESARTWAIAANSKCGHRMPVRRECDERLICLPERLVRSHSGNGFDEQVAQSELRIERAAADGGGQLDRPHVSFPFDRAEGNDIRRLPRILDELKSAARG